MKIAIINGIVEKNDAISRSVIDMADLFSLNGWNVHVFCTSSHFEEDLRINIVANAAQLLERRFYREADFIVYHFGVYYALFDASLVGNGRAKQIVYFHNITPKKYLPAQAWPIIEKSFQRAHLMKLADEVWAVSDENRSVAQALGIEPSRIVVVPLVVDAPPLTDFVGKAEKPLSVGFVGRAVRSKGLMDLAKAAAIAAQRGILLNVKIVNNLRYSDLKYYNNVKDFVIREGLSGSFCFSDCLPDLRPLYGSVHLIAVPSFHEGFCKPIIEGLRAGCVPVGYSSHSIPQTAKGLGCLVDPGDIKALAKCLIELMTTIPDALTRPDDARLQLDIGLVSANGFDERRRRHVAQFEPNIVNESLVSRLKALGLR